MGDQHITVEVGGNGGGMIFGTSAEIGRHVRDALHTMNRTTGLTIDASVIRARRT